MAVVAAGLSEFVRRSMNKVPKINVKYFGIAGAGEKLRLALVLKGIEFTDERIAGPEWVTEKPKSKFGVLPEVTFDDKVFGQSDACLRYIATLPGDEALMPSDPLEALLVDEVLGVAGDLDRAWSYPLYLGMRPNVFGYEEGSQSTEEGKARTEIMRKKFLLETLPTFMGYYEAFLSEKNAFMCGDKITIADCVILPQLVKFMGGFIDYVPADCLDKYPKITAYLERVKSMPAIKEWYAKAH